MQLLAMQGEIQRLHRKFDRRPRGDNVNPGRRPSPADPDVRLLPHNVCPCHNYNVPPHPLMLKFSFSLQCECKSLEEKLVEFEEKMKVSNQCSSGTV